MENNKPIIINDKKSVTDFVIKSGVMVKVVEIFQNTGQVPGLPQNPRYILEKGIEDLDNSLKEDPEFLFANRPVLFPYAGAYVAIAGNQRVSRCAYLGILEIPCDILNPNVSPDKLRRFMVKDNIAYGKNDWDIFANEFELEELIHMGLEMPDLDLHDLDGEDDDNGPDNNDLKITVTFNSNFEKFDLIKDRILAITSEFEGIDVKG